MSSEGSAGEWAAFLAWPAPSPGGAPRTPPSRGERLTASLVATIICLVLAAVSMAMPLVDPGSSPAWALGRHVLLFCHLV